MDSLQSLVRDLIREQLATEDVGMRTKGYKAGTWDDVLRPALESLFADVGVRQIDAKRDVDGSHIKVLLKNGDSIRGITSNSPLSGQVVNNGKWKKKLNSPEAMTLVTTMKRAWEEYRGAQ